MVGVKANYNWHVSTVNSKKGALINDGVKITHRAGHNLKMNAFNSALTLRQLNE